MHDLIARDNRLKILLEAKSIIVNENYLSPLLLDHVRPLCKAENWVKSDMNSKDIEGGLWIKERELEGGEWD